MLQVELSLKLKEKVSLFVHSYTIKEEQKAAVEKEINLFEKKTG